MRKLKPTRTALSLEQLEDRCVLSAGALDPTFGTGGIVTTNVGLPDATHETAHAVALQPDGKVVAVGRASTGIQGRSFSSFAYDLAVVRYNTNGTLDNSFSSDGKTITPLGGSPSDVEVQNDGKIVVSGNASGAFTLVRYNTNGAVDSGFGGKAKGVVTTNIGKNTGDAALAMELQADGKIVLAGVTRANNSSLYDLALVRYNVDGSLDTSFSGDGKTTTHFSSSVSGGPIAMEMAIYAGTSPHAGKIVVVADLTSDRGTIVARYNTNGNLDTSFGGGAGYVTLASLGAPYDLGAAVAIQADDRVVVSLSGSGSGGADSSDIYLVCLQSNGSLDPAFGSSGIVHAMLPETQGPTSVAIQADGKIVAAGYYAGAQSFAMRYNSNGSVDTAFGANGIAIVTGVTTMFNNQVDVAIQSDGKLVLAGGTPDGDFALARLQADDPPAALQAASVSDQVVAQNVSRDLDEPHWFVNTTPTDDYEFILSGNQPAQNCIDLFTVVMHQLDHLLGHTHNTGGVMAESLAVGVRDTEVELVDGALYDEIFAPSGESQTDTWLNGWLAEDLNSIRARGQRRG